jgi:hypothetical protein
VCDHRGHQGTRGADDEDDWPTEVVIRTVCVSRVSEHPTLSV